MRLPGRGLARRLLPLCFFFLTILISSGAAPNRASEMSPTGKVVGHVRSSDGKAIARAQVFLVGGPIHTQTDSSGAYTLSFVPVGQVEIRAAFIGYASSQATVTVRAGLVSRHDFVLQPTNLELEEMVVTAADAAASPARGAVAQGNIGRQKVSPVPQPAPNYPEATPIEPWRGQREPGNTEAYARIEENRFLAAASNPLSTF